MPPHLRRISRNAAYLQTTTRRWMTMSTIINQHWVTYLINTPLRGPELSLKGLPFQGTTVLFKQLNPGSLNDVGGKLDSKQIVMRLRSRDTLFAP